MKLSRIAFLVATSALASLSISAQAQTITLERATAGTPLTSYSEGPLTITASTGGFLFGSATNDAPTTHLVTGYFNTSTNSILNLTSAAGLFSFISLGYSGSTSNFIPGGRADGMNSVTFTGFDGAAQLFSQTVVLGDYDGFDNYMTLTGPTAAIDRLNIATQGFVLNLDNIVTSSPIAAAVPEPATWAMMIAGFGAVGFAMRRRRTQATVRFA